MARPSQPLNLSDAEREELDDLRLAHSNFDKTGGEIFWRAHAVLGRAAGLPDEELARESGLTRVTIRKWISRYRALGIEGLRQDAPRSGRPKQVSPEKEQAILECLAVEKQMTVREVAELHGVSPATVSRLRRNGTQASESESKKQKSNLAESQAEKIWDKIFGIPKQ